MNQSQPSYSNYDMNSIASPINYTKLRDLLTKTNYDKEEADFLIDGFENGFSLEYRGSFDRKDKSENILFTPGIGNQSEMWDKIMKEVKMKRFIGPWKEEDIPFSHYVQSPIGLVPKAGGKTRLIFHLSYKFKNGNPSVNECIPPELCTVKYRDMDHCVSNCLTQLKERSGRFIFNCIFFGKTDLQSAFRLAPLKRRFWPILLLKARDPQSGIFMYFADKCMPFGASISCAHFQRISNALKHIVEVLEQAWNVISNYLDDFLFVHYIRSQCNRVLRKFIKICQEICFPVAEDKTEWAAEIIVFLGIVLNGRQLTLMIPEDKKWKAINLLTKFANAKKVTIKDIQVLTGTLNFLNRAIVPGRVFTRRMYKKLEHKTVSREGKILKPHHHVTLDKEFKNDCLMWTIFLGNQTAVNRPFVDMDRSTSANDIGFFTDSSKNENFGFGCYLGKLKQWTFGIWEPGFIKQKDPSIAYLELYALCVGIFCWQENLTNGKLLLHCDNESIVHMVNNMTSGCKNCMYLLKNADTELLEVQQNFESTVHSFKIKYFGRFVE